MSQCTAIAKHSGERCKQVAVNGTTKCHYHGGKSLRGAASPTFKHGQRSKHMPTQIAARYEASRNDPELGDLMSNIALREAFIRERLEVLERGGDMVSVVDNLRENYKALYTAYHAVDNHGMAVALEKYRFIIEDGQRYANTRNEIESALDSQRRDIEAHENILHKGDNAIALDKLMTFMGALIGLLTVTISDKRELNEVLTGVDRLLIQPERTTESLGAGTAVHNGNGA